MCVIMVVLALKKTHAANYVRKLLQDDINHKSGSTAHRYVFLQKQA